MEEILPEHFHKIGGKMNVTNGGIREVNPMTCGYGSIIWYSGQNYELVELESYTLEKKNTLPHTYEKLNLTSGRLQDHGEEIQQFHNRDTRYDDERV